jgi:hypothetical protein
MTPEECDNKITYIYILKHPDTLEIKYVGKSIEPKKRYIQHSNYKIQLNSKSKHLSNWLLTFLKDGKKPIMEIIEECLEKWEDREIYWIDYYIKSGNKLCNISKGGKGCSGHKMSDDEKQKRSKAFKGKNIWMKGKVFSNEWRSNISKATKGGKNPSAKKVIDTCTNKIFESSSIAAEFFNMKRTTLTAMLIGQNKNKTSLKFLI